MIINNKLNWQEVLDYYKQNNSINNDWIVKDKIALSDKFFIIGLLNDYINEINEVYFDKNYDLYVFEVYKRLLILGQYLGMIPALSDCSTKIYEELENNGVIDDIIKNLPYYDDYIEFMAMADKYINIDVQICLTQIVQQVNKLADNVIDLITENNIAEALEDKADIIQQLGDLIGFNNPEIGEILNADLNK